MDSLISIGTSHRGKVSSLVIQAVIAATVSAGFVYRRFMLAILSFRFGKKSDSGDDAALIEDDEALA
jgi:hypothetical protein